jgi:hypothetical protein
MGKADRELLKIGQQSDGNERGFARAIDAESTILTENGAVLRRRWLAGLLTLLGGHGVPTLHLPPS